MKSHAKALPDSPIRLAYIVHRFGTGGQERCIAALVNGLPETLVEPIVISFDDRCEATKWIQRKNVKVVSLKKGFPNDPRLVLRLVNTFKQHDIEIAHSHNWGTLIDTGIATRLCGVTHIHAEHGLEFGHRESGLRGRIKPFLKRKFFKHTDALVAIAECVKTRLNSVYRVSSDHITLIPNGVPTPEVVDRNRSYQEVRRRLQIPDNTLIAGSVGRVAPVKGFDFAISAFQSLSENVQRSHLVIVGDGPEMDRLRALSRELGLSDRVHLVGHQHDIGFWLAGFDLFFNSSRSEAMNLAILEAMATGLPVVATDVGDNALLVRRHGICGLVTKAGDEGAFAEALETALNDQALRTKWGLQSATVYQNNFTVDRMIESYLSLYQNLQRSQSNPPLPVGGFLQ